MLWKGHPALTWHLSSREELTLQVLVAAIDVGLVLDRLPRSVGTPTFSRLEYEARQIQGAFNAHAALAEGASVAGDRWSAGVSYS